MARKRASDGLGVVKGYFGGLWGAIADAAGCLEDLEDDLEARLTFVDLGILTQLMGLRVNI